MPLNLVRRPGSQSWYLRGTVAGRRVYESAGTADRARAEQVRRKRDGEVWDEAVLGPKATAGFGQAVASYVESRPPAATTRRHLARLMLHFGDAPLRAIDQTALDHAYAAILTKRAGHATRVRAVLTPLRAVLEHAARRGLCDRPAFETPRVAKPRTAFLLPKQVLDLIREAAPHVRPLLVFLFGTGCRMSEALELDWSRVDLAGARARVDQKQGTERHVDLPPVVIAALSALPGRAGAVFVTPAGAPYRSTGRTGGGQVKTAWAGACARAGLPGEWREWARPDRPSVWRRFAPEHTPHVARHTWASWHYCQHRDLLRLKDEGGWETISMVTRYAKKVPDRYRADIEAWLAGGVQERERVA